MCLCCTKAVTMMIAASPSSRGGWDHEHCRLCERTIEPMIVCWVTATDGPLSSSVQTAIARCNADRCGAASVSCLVEFFDEQSLIASMPFDQGVFILDEPEAALPPQRQLSFLKIMHGLATTERAQFLRFFKHLFAEDRRT